MHGELTALHRLARWAHELRLEHVPPHVREQAVNQILSTLAATYAGWDSDLGPLLERALPAVPGSARIVPSGGAATPAHAAMLMASWSMVLDFDDVMLGGHTGHSSVLVPLAYAEGHDGADLLLAQIVANEIAARVNMVCAVGATRGQMATHLHLLAAAAARARLENLDEETFAAALAFAVSYPAHALYPAFLGSDAKALCAAWPIRMGLEAVDAVRAGMAAPRDPLDDVRGLFATLARVPVRDFLGGLGTRWHTATNSVKLYPVCGYLCAAVDAVLDLVREHDVAADDVDAVDVRSSLFTVGMDAHSSPYLDGPRSRIATLTFSTPFVVASAILAREFTPAQLKRRRIEDPRVWALAARVRNRHDVSLTLRALRADIPIGAALRRVARWKAAVFAWTIARILGRARHPWQTLRLVAGATAAAGESRPLDIGAATKPLGAHVEMKLRDGRILRRSVAIPRGFAGRGDDDVRALMREKFVAAASPALGAARAATVAASLERIETLPSAALSRLLDAACAASPQAAYQVLHSAATSQATSRGADA